MKYMELYGVPLVQHRPHRTLVFRRMGARHATTTPRKPALCRHDRFKFADTYYSEHSTRRNLQFGSTESRKSKLRCPEYTAETDAVGTLRLLEAVRILGLENKPAFTRLLLPNSLDWCRKYPNEKPHRFIRAVHMA